MSNQGDQRAAARNGETAPPRPPGPVGHFAKIEWAVTELVRLLTRRAERFRVGDIVEMWNDPRDVRVVDADGGDRRRRLEELGPRQVGLLMMADTSDIGRHADAIRTIRLGDHWLVPDPQRRAALRRRDGQGHHETPLRLPAGAR